jgi:hypothetical protein
MKHLLADVDVSPVPGFHHGQAHLVQARHFARQGLEDTHLGHPHPWPHHAFLVGGQRFQARLEPNFPVTLTQAQRKVVAEIIPLLADRLKPEEQNRQTIPLTLDELKAVNWLAKHEARHAESGMRWNTLRHVTDLTAQALDRSRDRGDAPGPAPADVDRP